MMECDCTFDNTGQIHEWDCFLHPNRAMTRIIKVDVYEDMLRQIEQLQAQLEAKNKSTPECRATCEVYKDWEKAEADNAGLVTELEQHRKKEEKFSGIVNKLCLDIEEACPVTRPVAYIDGPTQEPDGENTGGGDGEQIVTCPSCGEEFNAKE